jgi:dimethylargininase
MVRNAGHLARNEGEKLRKVIVSSPAREFYRVDDRKIHNIGEVADPERARSQHDALKSVLADSGCRVIDVPELDGHPNSVFTRDAAVVTPRGFIEMRMGLPSRRGEEAWMSEALRSLGVPKLGTIEEPGTAEGGDIILAGCVVFIGTSGRTNDEGAAQVASLFHDLGFEVRQARVPAPYLHLGGAMSMLGAGLVLSAKNVFAEDIFRGFETIATEDRTFAGANVICLGEKEAVVSRSHTALIELLLPHGVTVHAVDFSEFLKGTGGPSCLIVPVERG